MQDLRKSAAGVALDSGTATRNHVPEEPFRTGGTPARSTGVVLERVNRVPEGRFREGVDMRGSGAVRSAEWH